MRPFTALLSFVLLIAAPALAQDTVVLQEGDGWVRNPRAPEGHTELLFPNADRPRLALEALYIGEAAVYGGSLDAAVEKRKGRTTEVARRPASLWSYRAIEVERIGAVFLDHRLDAFTITPSGKVIRVVCGQYGSSTVTPDPQAWTDAERARCRLAMEANVHLTEAAGFAARTQPATRSATPSSAQLSPEQRVREAIQASRAALDRDDAQSSVQALDRLNQQTDIARCCSRDLVLEVALAEFRTALRLESINRQRLCARAADHYLVGTSGGTTGDNKDAINTAYALDCAGRTSQAIPAYERAAKASQYLSDWGVLRTANLRLFEAYECVNSAGPARAHQTCAKKLLDLDAEMDHANVIVPIESDPELLYIDAKRSYLRYAIEGRPGWRRDRINALARMYLELDPHGRHADDVLRLLDRLNAQTTAPRTRAH